jgi:NADH-quinone oxidoreductase subunit J
MTPIQYLFLLTAAAILVGAFLMVTRQNLVHAALYLVLVLFGVAVLFVLLEAGFLAVVQVLVYIGAIAILMIFALMLTRGDVENVGRPMNPNYGWTALISAMFLFGLVILLGQWPGFGTLAPAFAGAEESIVELGTALVSPNAYVIPFEVASVMLLAALIGALVVARPQDKED